MELIFELVLIVCADWDAPLFVGLGPEILDIVAPTEFEANKVVYLAGTWRFRGHHMILGISGALVGSSNVAIFLGAESGRTDNRLRENGVGNAWGKRMVGKRGTASIGDTRT